MSSWDPRAFDEVLSAAREGDVPALGEMYRAFQPSLVRYLRANAPDAADDLASETWIDVAGGLRRFDGGEHGLFRRWLVTSRTGGCSTSAARCRGGAPIRRRRWRWSATTRRPDTQAEALGRIDSETALRRVGKLPPEQAEIVLLPVVAGLSADDVAAILGKTPGNVRVIQHRALTQLARQTERVER